MFHFLISAAEAACPAGTTCLVNPIGTTSLATFIGRIINAGMGVLGSVTLLVFFYGGFLWLTSAGDAKKVDEGTNIMKWAVIGLVIIFGAFGLVQLVFRVVNGS
jgi:hypothetical protein